MKSHPITVTIGKINDKLIVDAGMEEEQVMDARLSMAINDEGNICAVQKGLSGYFTPQQLIEASKLAKEKAARNAKEAQMVKIVAKNKESWSNKRIRSTIRSNSPETIQQSHCRTQNCSQMPPMRLRKSAKKKRWRLAM